MLLKNVLSFRGPTLFVGPRNLLFPQPVTLNSRLSSSNHADLSYHSSVRRRFFVEEFDVDRAVLRGDAAHHLGRVLRAQPGQLYELSDGEALWLARTERVGRDAVEFALVERLPAHAQRLRLTLLLSIVKFDRFEWSLEKATELGVGEIVPLAAARSEKALLGAAAKRAARWQKILLESAQQARRLCVPVLRPAVDRKSVV